MHDAPWLRDPERAAPAGGSVNIARLLWHAADRWGSRPAVVEGGRTTTYEALRRRAHRISGLVREAGAVEGGRVALFLDRGAEAAAAFFGVAAAGGVVVQVNEALRPRQVEHILGHSGARILLASSRLLGRRPRPVRTSATVVELGEEAPATSPEVAEPIARIGTDVAQIIYTSGSTGLPRGVVVSHANLWAGTAAVVEYLGIEGRDRIAGLLPFSFDYGLSQLLCAVARGATLVVERSPVAPRIVASLREQDVTVLAGVPPVWLRLLQVEAFRTRPLPALRVLTNTGGHLPLHAVRELRAAYPGARLYLMYGLTEAFRSTFLPPEEVDGRPGSIGRAIPGTEIFVLRDDGTPCEPGEVGELVHRGPTVALGYWNDPDATRKVFRANPLRPEGTPGSERVVFSGDLVVRDPDGFLYFVGRRDRMLKVLGHRVSPEEVTEALYASGEVDEAVVSSEPDELLGDRIIADVVLKPSGSRERLVAFCGAELPRHLRPGRFRFRDSLPRTPSGKHAVPGLAGPP